MENRFNGFQRRGMGIKVGSSGMVVTQDIGMLVMGLLCIFLCFDWGGRYMNLYKGENYIEL